MNKLKQMRVDRKMSQSKLAEASGVNVRMIQHYEQGSKDINGAHLSTLLKLANGLDCALADIISDEDSLELMRNAKFL